LTALGHLELTEHVNNMIAAQLIESCVNCALRDDANAARLLLYTAGAVVDSNLTIVALHRLLSNA
jgi:hypothetical protein